MSACHRQTFSLVLLDHAARGCLMAILCSLILLGRLIFWLEQGDQLAGCQMPFGAH